MYRSSVASAALALAAATFCLQTVANAKDAFMTVGVATSVPLGHHIFCNENPDACKRNENVAAPQPLDQDLMKTIAEVNIRANTSIRAVSDQELYGVEERWTYPDGAGDCEDYALLKRKRLQALGIAPSNLLLTVVERENGEGHAVLTLRTERGDFILDNLDWRIRNWRDTPYTYVKRQSTAHSGKWVTLQDDAELLVSSVDEDE